MIFLFLKWNMKIIDSYKKNPTYFCLWIFIIIFSIIIFGLIFLPSVFYDQWIWKHYWGPTVADAFEKNVSFNGVIAHEGYTIISELTYGFILISLKYNPKYFITSIGWFKLLMIAYSTGFPLYDSSSSSGGK